MQTAINFFNWLLDSILQNIPAELAVIIIGALFVAWKDRQKYKKAMDRLLRQEHESLVLVEQVVLQKVEDKMAMFFRDLPGMTSVEKLFHKPELVAYLHRAADDRTLANPVLELDDEGWPGALKLLFSHVRSACSAISGYKRQDYYLVATCWKRGGDVSAIRVFVVPTSVFRALAFDNHGWWQKLLIEESNHTTRLLALRQAALQYFGKAKTKGPAIDIVVAQIAAPTDWWPKKDRLMPIRWSDWETQLAEVGLSLKDIAI